MVEIEKVSSAEPLTAGKALEKPRAGARSPGDCTTACGPRRQGPPGEGSTHGSAKGSLTFKVATGTKTVKVSSVVEKAR
jgi:hypothetical protein